MSMDVDDGAVARRHSHRGDSVGMSTSDPSLPSDPQNHHISGSVRTSIHSLPSYPPPDRERLPGSNDSPQFMILPSPTSPVYRLGETSDIHQNPGPSRQHRDILPSSNPSEQEVAPRKRKRTHDLPPTLVMDHDHIPLDDTFTDGANPQSRRRVRPRLRTQLDREFSPLLIMSPGSERNHPMEEETISAFHYPPNVTDPSHSIRRYFHLPEHGPRILQSSSSPKLDDMEDRQPEERGRSDSASSFAQVALAPTATRKHGRLSTLEDLSLPRPFEDTERPPLDLGSIKVHERGLEVPPFFLSTGGGRMGGLGASRESAGSPTDALGHPIRASICEDGTHAVSSRSAMLPLEPSSTTGNFFDKPICDSPDPIDSDEDGQFVCRTTGNSDGR
jgi:hypothetical protein